MRGDEALNSLGRRSLERLQWRCGDGKGSSGCRQRQRLTCRPYRSAVPSDVGHVADAGAELCTREIGQGERGNGPRDWVSAQNLPAF